MILTVATFDPSQGGHARADLRDAFIQAVDSFENWQAGQEPTVPFGFDQVPVKISGVARHLARCTDRMPGALCQQLRLPVGATYGAGAEELLRRIGLRKMRLSKLTKVAAA